MGGDVFALKASQQHQEGHRAERALLDASGKDESPVRNSSISARMR
jgi:hypothetical protein